MSELRTGARLSLDWGLARIGVAACDPRGTLAYPVETIRNVGGEDAVASRLSALVGEYDPIEIVVGLPRHLKGVEGDAAAKVRERARWLARQFPSVAVRLVDERLTTVVASRNLHAAGRDSRKQKAVIDQAAAVAILENALATERNSGRPTGELITAEGDR